MSLFKKLNRRNIFITLIFLCSPFFLIAQPVNDQAQKSFVNSQIEYFFSSLKYTTNESLNPVHFNPWTTVAVGGITAFCYLAADKEFREEYVVEKDYQPLNIPRKMSLIGEIYDKPSPAYFTAGLLAATYGSGLLFSDNKLKQTSILMVHSLIITGLYSMGLKMLIGRARPYTGKGPHNFRIFNYKFDSDYMSMPSGHTSSIFAMMSVLAGQYDSYFVKIPAYTFAVAVAFQRVDNNKHWASDVIIGGVLGYLVGSGLVQKQKKEESSFSLQPVLNKNGFGLKLSF